VLGVFGFGGLIASPLVTIGPHNNNNMACLYLKILG
jgi:hypothetical protein